MRWVRRSTWLLWAATLVVAAVGLALLVWDWSTPVPRGSFGIRGFSGLWAVGFGSMGALLTWRRPGHLVGWIFAAAGLVAAVQFATFEYALAAYNAGDNRVVDWQAAGPYSGLDEFVESIPFTETREYVEAILRNEETYKAIDKFAHARNAVATSASR